MKIQLDTLSDELLIEAYNDAKAYHLNADFIHLLKSEILRRIIAKMLAESKTIDITYIKSCIDTNEVNEYLNLA